MNVPEPQFVNRNKIDLGDRKNGAKFKSNANLKLAPKSNSGANQKARFHSEQDVNSVS